MKRISVNVTKLKQEFCDKLENVKRDASSLEEVGVTTEKLTEWENLRNELDALYPDSILLSNQKEKTQQKDELCFEVLKQSRKMLLNLQIAYGKAWVKSRALGNIPASATKNLVVLGFAEKVIKLLNETPDLLTKTGLTSEQVNNYQTIVNGLNQAITLKQGAVNDRDIGAAIRSKMAKRVMEQLRIMSETGKVYWRFAGENAKANDYAYKYLRYRPKNKSEANQ